MAQLFSQIPSAVLNKINADEYTRKKRKTVKFYDDIFETESELIQENATSEQVTSSKGETDPSESPEKSVIFKTDTITSCKPQKSALKITEEIKSPSSSPLKETSDAILQADLSLKLIGVGTQTDESFFKTIAPLGLCSYCRQCRAQQANSLSHEANVFKPMYSIPKRAGEAPPLKIGLSLPKGKKRKVYYPDEDS